MPRSFVLLALVLLLVPAMAGCLGMYTAHVPGEVLTGGWSESDRGGGERWLGLAARWEHITYRVDPPQSGAFDDGPYAASLTVMTIDTPERLTREEVSDRLATQVLDNARDQGIVIDNRSKQVGERSLASGVRTLYFTYEAEIGSGSSFFDPGRDARVIGEVWFDEREGTTVLVVGLAQIQGGGTAGQYFIDRHHWFRIVADPRGSIEGHVGEKGLIHNVRSHES